MGTSSLGPDAPVNGLIRFNQSTTQVEVYYNSVWNAIAKVGLVGLTIDEFTGNNSTTSFVMSRTVADPANIFVTISGIYQAPTNNYTVSGTTLTFTSPPPAVDTSGNPNKIIVIHGLNSTNAA